MENGNTELEWSKGQLPLATFDPLCASSALTEPGKLPKARRPRMRRLSFLAHHIIKGHHITKGAERMHPAVRAVPCALCRPPLPWRGRCALHFCFWKATAHGIVSIKEGSRTGPSAHCTQLRRLRLACVLTGGVRMEWQHAPSCARVQPWSPVSLVHPAGSIRLARDYVCVCVCSGWSCS
jgi:hypothetical protein